MIRKIVQLVTRPGLVSLSDTRNPLTFALCDDGSVWVVDERDGFDGLRWEPLPPIPQDANQ